MKGNDGVPDVARGSRRVFVWGKRIRWIMLRSIALNRQKRARQLAIVSSPLWGLESNARHHGFVRTAVDYYIESHRDEPAARALQSVTTAF